MGMGFDPDRLLRKPIEELAPQSRGAPVEAKRELVQVVVLLLYRAMFNFHHGFETNSQPAPARFYGWLGLRLWYQF
jgi:hypothetical protein